MDLRDLGFFEVIASAGHLGRAAEQLRRSQPALSKCIDRLEQHVGAPLFDHVGRGLRLTAVGAVLLEQAALVRRSVDQATRRVAQQANGSVGHVRIGAASSMIESVLPDIIARLLQQAPGIRVAVLTAPSDGLRAMLRDQQVDLVIGPLSEHDKTEFVVDLLTSDAMVVAVGVGHPLLSRPDVTMRDLTDYRWLLSHQLMPGRRWLEAKFKERMLPPPIIQVETNAVLLLVNAVAQTELLTFASRRDIEQGKGAGLLRELPVRELTMHRDWGLVHPPLHELSPASTRVLALMKEVSEAFIVAHPPAAKPVITAQPSAKPRASATRSRARVSRKSMSAPIER